MIQTSLNLEGPLEAFCFQTVCFLFIFVGFVLFLCVCVLFAVVLLFYSLIWGFIGVFFVGRVFFFSYWKETILIKEAFSYLISQLYF